MTQILILASSTTEANRYAKLVELPRFSYRYVARAGTIHGNLRRAEVHVLPSFLERRDRHRVLSALQWTHCEVFYCDPADFARPEGYTAPITDALEHQGINPATPAEWSGIEEQKQADWEAFAEEQQLVADRAAALRDEITPAVAEVFAKAADFDPETVEVGWGAEEYDPAKDPKVNPDGRKRRYTCDVCSQKVWSDVDPAHDSDAHATTEALKQPSPSNFFG